MTERVGRVEMLVGASATDLETRLELLDERVAEDGAHVLGVGLEALESGEYVEQALLVVVQQAFVLDESRLELLEPGDHMMIQEHLVGRAARLGRRRCRQVERLLVVIDARSRAGL